MANNIVGLFFGLALPIPLLISLLYLAKILIDSKRNDKLGLFIAKILMCLIFSAISIFLIFVIVNKFVFFINIDLPQFLEMIGLILFLLYYFSFAAIIYGFGMLGHGGVSPGKIILEIYQTFKKEGDEKGTKIKKDNKQKPKNTLPDFDQSRVSTRQKE